MSIVPGSSIGVHGGKSASADLHIAGPTLSIVLATLNERENLPDLIRQLTALGLPPLEIVVVDDGSTDGTREYLLSISGKDRRIRPIFHDGAQTLTPAQCQGIVNSRGDLVVIMDADLQHPPRGVPKLVAELDKGAAVVVGTRYGPGGTVGRRRADRAILSRGADGIARCLLTSARGSSDPMSGFFGFRREIFRPLVSRSPGYKLLLYLLVMARDRKVAEVPYEFAARKGGASKIAHGFGFFRVFLAEVLRARRLEEYLRDKRRRSKAGGILPGGIDEPAVVGSSSRSHRHGSVDSLGGPPGLTDRPVDFPSGSLTGPIGKPSLSIEPGGPDAPSLVLRPQR